MKTVKVTTWLDPEEVERFLGFLSDLQDALWRHYGEDIIARHQEALRQEQKRQLTLDWDDPVPF